MAKKKIMILGAGLAGLSTAWHLQKKRIDYRVFEKEPEVGGLCRSKNINGFTFDYDGHLIHFKNRYTFELIRNLLKNNLAKHQRSAWIYSCGRYTRFPFQANLYGLPPAKIQECLLGFIHASNNGRLQKNTDSSFLGWINSTFGRGIAKYFMIPYNTKFWTMPPQRLTCEWLDGFIPVPSLSQIIEGTVEESKRRFGYNSVFWYPKEGGISRIPRALAEQIKNINTDCPITEINLDKKEITIGSGTKEKFDYLISTIPLPEIPYLIKDMPKKIGPLFKKLRWNSIFNLNLGIDRLPDSKRHWVYFPEKEFCFFRAGFLHNFSDYLVPANKTSIYVEVSYSKDRPINKNEIVLRIKRDLKKAGLLDKSDNICAEDINDIKYGYPIFDINYRKIREKILRFLTQNNIISCGRYGSWRYMSMEDCLLEGKKIADIL